MRSKKLKLLFFILTLVVLVPSVFLGVLYYQVTKDASSRIQKGDLDRIIFSESPVYYDDGKTPIGVFFEKTHRKYIHYDEIPKSFIKAIVATEDRDFFSHWGFDPKSMLRAFIANIRSGRVVQGGSTLTQQTAKNIFKREKRSYLAKLKELMQAFLLERRFTKEEILEMYANQFFVTGYGKGLGIAAQYFFDKDAKDLNLVESAFIAGSVKGPNRYNPFIKKTEAEEEEARRLAKSRKDYVLSNMLKMHYITPAQYEEAATEEVPFKQGRITFALNVVLDYIREQLESEYFKKVLMEQGVDNIATSGVSIYTSINQDAQEAALRSLRSHLPIMEARLSGYPVEKAAGAFEEAANGGLRKSQDGLPFLTRITHIDTGRKNGHLVVSWDDGGGVIDYDGLKPIGDAWLKWKKGGGAAFDRGDVPLFLKNFHVGDLVPVQILNSADGDGGAKLTLSLRPDLDGGIVVLQRGMIKAMVGGTLDRYFNRAVDAKRQLGSIFKPLVYTAALQLKWNNLDTLSNRRDLYQFEKTVYMPRPDHEPRSEEVSMAWAGAKSENLATVWLLYHLTDRLNMSEFKQVMDRLGLSRKADESYEDYQKRIRDDYGVVVDDASLKEAAFQEAKKEIVSDLIFNGYERSLPDVNRLHFSIDKAAIDLEDKKEFADVLRYDFEKLRETSLRMKVQLQRVSMLTDQYLQDPSPESRANLMEALGDFYRTDEEGRQDALLYTTQPQSVSNLNLLPVTPEWLLVRSLPLDGKAVLIDGLIPSEALDMLEAATEKGCEKLLSRKRYEPEILCKVRDFRTLVNLAYVVRLSKDLGISTKLDPVLSFPLGSNSISILEAALAYQTIMTGRAYPLNGRSDPEMTPVIAKIVDRNGETLWQYDPEPARVLSERVSTLATEILRNVMRNGTGRGAKDAVQVLVGVDDVNVGVSIPSYGKTGTANRYTNSSFVGFFPAPDEQNGRLDLLDGYVVASYVGYDDNRPMKTGRYAIYGSSGALPLWIDTANAIVNSPDYRKNLEPAELAFSSGVLPVKGALQTVRVSPVNGLPRSLSDQGPAAFPVVLTDLQSRADAPDLGRAFEPLGAAVE